MKALRELLQSRAPALERRRERELVDTFTFDFGELNGDRMQPFTPEERNAISDFAQRVDPMHDWGSAEVYYGRLGGLYSGAARRKRAKVYP